MFFSIQRDFSKFLALTILALCCFSTHIDCEEHILGNKFSYRGIGDMYIRSFGLEKDADLNEESLGVEVANHKFQPIQLTINEKRTLTFNLLARREGRLKKQDNELLNNALEDLEIFYASGRDTNSLFDHFNNTRMIFGEAVFGKILANPTTDQDLLRDRQAFIKELVQNEVLFNKLDLLVSRVQESEEDILSFWKEENSVAQKAIQSLYFTNRFLKKLNKNSMALEFLTRMRNLKTGLIIGGDALLFFGAHYTKERMQHGMNASLWNALKGTVKSSWQWINPMAWVDNYRSIYSSEGIELLRASNIDFRRDLGMNTLTDDELALAVKSGQKVRCVILGLQAALFTTYLTLKSLQVKSAVSLVIKDNNTQNYMHQRLISVGTLVSAIKEIDGLAGQNQLISDACLTLDQSMKLFADTSGISSDAKKLINLLQMRTFSGNASAFSLTGRVLSAYQLMGSAKDELIGLMETIGELDAYLSIAKLYKKHKELPTQYCFADYVVSEKPVMNALGFWNPVLNTQKAVLNDFVLGGHLVERNGVLTGSNTGGKSTCLKALAINALLAQTIGIVPAAAYTITPFEVIGTSLNIRDNTEEGQSLFKAEVLRAQKLVEEAKNLSDGSFGFYLIDELFTGTAPEKGQEAAYQVASTLSGLEQLIYLWSTHYPRLTEIEIDTCGACKNYKMEAYLDDETGELVRPFKLEAGISASNIALDILKLEMD